jgi:hypothetical protein
LRSQNGFSFLEKVVYAFGGNWSCLVEWQLLVTRQLADTGSVVIPDYPRWLNWCQNVRDALGQVQMLFS